MRRKRKSTHLSTSAGAPRDAEGGKRSHTSRKRGEKGGKMLWLWTRGRVKSKLLSFPAEGRMRSRKRGRTRTIHGNKRRQARAPTIDNTRQIVLTITADMLKKGLRNYEASTWNLLEKKRIQSIHRTEDSSKLLRETGEVSTGGGIA